MIYSQWNQALISYFTSGMPQGSKIYLSVDEEVLESIGQYFSSSPTGGNWCADFCVAVKQEVIVDEQVKLSHLPGKDEQGLPKGVAFLGAMVLAAYQMAEDEEVNQSNFFQRFKEILDLHKSEYSRPLGMKSGEEESLWQDWALWLRQKGLVPSAQQGEGSRIYINYPISQTLLRQTDKAQLYQLFTEKHWQVQWDAQTLIVRVRQETSRFPQHLQGLLTGYQFKSRYETIAEAIHDVYEQWHGEGCPTTVTKKTTPTWSHHLFAGLYRTENVFSGVVEYFVYPKQTRKRQLQQIAIQHEEAIYNLIEERPGWYEPMEWNIGENELETGARYLVQDSEALDDLILPQRDFWILVHDPTNPDSADYASWGIPSLGEKFVLLCKQELLSQLEFLQTEHLLVWQRQSYPFGESSDWIELHECMVISPVWEGVFIENQALKNALQPSVHLLVSFSGGLRVPNHLGKWLIGYAPQVTIFGFYPTVELKVTQLPDNAIIFENVQKTNTPISINFPKLGEYLIEATYAGESNEQFIQIVDWDKLSITEPQHRETLSIGNGQICGSVIENHSDPVLDKSVIEVTPIEQSISDKSVIEVKPLDKSIHSSDKPVGKKKPSKESSQTQQLSLF
ncbi:MAG: hypothetical protein VSS75_014935 [Candidatus Parabeggiatoa sp.]|nr:hypothetical protein [Candidatus Parabeggiatoa sp.]